MFIIITVNHQKRQILNLQGLFIIPANQRHRNHFSPQTNFTITTQTVIMVATIMLSHQKHQNLITKVINQDLVNLQRELNFKDFEGSIKFVEWKVITNYVMNLYH